MNHKYISKTVYKVYDFISWQENKSLMLSPSFQRRPVWNKSAKSFLLDTVIKGFPIPIIFLREQVNIKKIEPIREIIDGQQRIRTLISFIRPQILDDYKPERDDFQIIRTHNKDLAGKDFHDLHTDVQKQILNYEFSVHVLPSDVEDSEVLQIFARMNSTGVKLNAQELRNAEFFGEFKSCMYNISYENLERWRDWHIFNENDIARMNEVEMVSDLVITMIVGLQGKSQPSLNKYYSMYDDTFPYKKEISRRFEVVMKKISDTVGDLIPDSPFSGKNLFSTLFLFYYELMFGLRSDLAKKNPNNIDKSVIDTFQTAKKKITEKDMEEDMLKVLRGGTGNLESRKSRLAFLFKIHNA